MVKKRKKNFNKEDKIEYSKQKNQKIFKIKEVKFKNQSVKFNMETK